ncbi:MAG TPA: MFS transporter, partial [Spirochaetota bacterium]
YLLSTAGFLLPSGMGSDLYGRKRVFLLGGILIIISSIGSVFSPTGNILLIFRVLQGSGAAMMFATSSPLVTTIFPPHKRGRMLGVSVAAVYLGLSAGPFLGGIFSHLYGWRSLFYLNAAGMTVAVIVGHSLIMKDQPDPATRGKHIDYVGSVLFAASVLCGMIGLTSIVSPKGLPLFIAGVGLLTLFLIYELRAETPLVPVRIFRRNRVFIFSNMAAMVNYSATFAISFFLSLYLQYVKGYTPDRAGFVLVAQPIVQSAFSPLAGKLSDTHDPRILPSAGMGIIALSLLVVALYPGVMPVGVIIIILAILGFGFALFSSPNTNAVLGSVEHRQLGIASSILGMMRVLGQVISMAFAILLVAHFVGGSRIDARNTPAFLTAVRIGFGIFSVLCIAGIPASWARGRKK